MKLEAEGGAGLARFSSACVNKLRLQTNVHVGFCLGEYSTIYKPFSQKTSCCLWVNEKWFRGSQCSQPIRWFRPWPLCSGMGMKMWMNVWEFWKSCASTPTKEYRLFLDALLKGLAWHVFKERLLIQFIYQRKKLIDNKEGKRDGSSTASWLKKMSINIISPQIFVDVLERKKKHFLSGFTLLYFFPSSVLAFPSSSGTVCVSPCPVIISPTGGKCWHQHELQLIRSRAELSPLRHWAFQCFVTCCVTRHSRQGETPGTFVKNAD